MVLVNGRFQHGKIDHHLEITCFLCHKEERGIDPLNLPVALGLLPPDSAEIKHMTAVVLPCCQTEAIELE